MLKIFQQHRTWNDLAALQEAQFPTRADFSLRLHRYHENDVVEDIDLDLASPQAEPFGDLDLLGMVAAPVEAHFAEIVVLRLDLDRHRAPAMRVGDVLVRQFLEIGVLEDAVERADEIVVSAVALRAVGRGEASDLGTEIVVIVAQSIERLGIFVMTDRAQRAGKTPKLLALFGAGESALCNQGIGQIFLANRDESIASPVRNRLWRLRYRVQFRRASLARLKDNCAIIAGETLAQGAT